MRTSVKEGGGIGAHAIANDRNRWLDLVRGASALFVCAGHLRSALFMKYAELSTHSAFVRIFYAFTGLGHQAVMIFFVLSGFFVGGSVLKRGDDFRWGHYGLARVSRLWTVLLPALAFTFLIDLVLRHFAPGVLRGEYFATWSSGPQAGRYSASLATLVGNIFFLQTVCTPVFGSNGPLWSLANEFWYYVLFPLFAYSAGLAGRGQGGISRPLCLVAAAIILFVLPPDIRAGFFSWLLGTAAFVLVSRGRGLRIPVSLGLAVFSLAVALGRMPFVQGQYPLAADGLVSMGFFLLVLATLHPQNSSRMPHALQAFAEGSSQISYSLYLFHFPVVAVIGGVFFSGVRLSPNMTGLAIYAAILSLLVLIGTVSWLAFESRTDAVRKAITGFLPGRRSVASFAVEGGNGR